MVGLLPSVAIAPALALQPPQLLAQAQLYGTLIPNDLNVRDGAGTDRPVLYVLHRDTVVRITGQYGDGADSWYRIVPMTSGYPQQEGRVSGVYLI
ncbi:SH3 domain-containing protein [Nodosilinea sp. E11]|uniref:SH3 domain-containing protein n=1 Tax=Nodosilinea sp. E11 TaxID=3037479 RepID=UPI0029350187|nr:SH3 domain-containing protein [Nodosilinea sp. E11]WOD41504.1 SH3 domain-containing protein [Nodosilinea sp. E11]